MCMQNSIFHFFAQKQPQNCCSSSCKCKSMSNLSGNNQFMFSIKVDNYFPQHLENVFYVSTRIILYLLTILYLSVSFNPLPLMKGNSVSLIKHLLKYVFYKNEGKVGLLDVKDQLIFIRQVTGRARTMTQECQFPAQSLFHCTPLSQHKREAIQ